MAQWVKNLTAVAQVPAEVRVPSLAQRSRLKDPVLLQLWCRSQLWLGFSTWPPQELPHAMGVALKRKEKGLGVVLDN